MSRRLELMAEELEKLRKKRTRMDEQIRDLEEKYKETENTEIHEIVHAHNLTPEQLAKVLKSLQHGKLPQGKIPEEVLGAGIETQRVSVGNGTVIENGENGKNE